MDTYELEDYDGYYEPEDNQEVKKGAASWGASLLIHGVLFFLISSFYILDVIKEIERPPVVLTTIDMPPDKEEPPEDFERVDLTEVVITTETEITDESEVITDLEFEEPESETDEPEITEEPMVEGREEAISDMEMGSAAFMAAIGSGGGGGGTFGRIKGGDKKRFASGYGENARRAQAASDRALKWLVKHQSENGQWDSDGYWANCLQEIKCEAGQDIGGADEAITGYALLCFLGFGYDHRTPNKYRKTITRGIDWLLSIQKPNGLIGSRNYEHPIATMALCEAYAMTMDKRLKIPCEKAIQVILERRGIANDYPVGWGYNAPAPERVDISVSGWNIMALKAAVAGGIDIGDGLSSSKKWIIDAWTAANPKWKNFNDYDKSVFPYTWDAITNKTGGQHLSFVGTLSGVFLGKQGIFIETLMNDVNGRWFDTGKYKKNSYCLYYSSLSAFMIGGEHWNDKWGDTKNGYVPWLIETMITDMTCNDGTWKHEEENWHGADTSPLLLHTYKLLALSVAVRYKRMN